MPLRNVGVTASNNPTGKDQGNINVTYRNSVGESFIARVLGPANVPATPAAPAVAPQGAAGAVTYRYRVAAVDASGVESAASAGGQTTTGNAVLSGANFNRVTWAAVSGAVLYRVYGRSGADGTHLRIAEVAITQFDDTGAVAPAGALPSGTPPANTVRLKIHSGGYKAIRNGIPQATTNKQTNAYHYRTK